MPPSKPWAWIALGAAILCGIALRLDHHADVDSRSPDEKVYTFYAVRVADGGLSVLPRLASEYMAVPGNWGLPSPLRLGNVLTAAAIMRISGSRDMRAVAGLSLASSILYLFLAALMGARFIDPWAASAGTFLLAVSVGQLGMARRAWQDSFFGLLCLIVMWLALEIARRPQRLWLYPLFLAAGACSFLTKESGGLCYAICGFWVVAAVAWKERAWKERAWKERAWNGRAWNGRAWKRAALLVVGGAASLAVTWAAWAAAAGSSSAAMGILRIVVTFPRTWTLQYCGGPWYQFFYLLWLVGPLTLLLAAVGMIAARSAGAGTSLAALIFVGFAAFGAFVPGFQYLRVMSPADAGYCLLAGFGFTWLLSKARLALSPQEFNVAALLSVAALLIEGVRNYHVFTSVVVAGGLEELAVSFIRSGLGR